jgi:hypothetical protein
MSSETFRPQQAGDAPSGHGTFEAPERIGGPLKPNHLVTTKIGIEEATPILHRLRVRCKTSLFMAETILNESAMVPAEYRLEIMDPIDPAKPACKQYTSIIFNALKEAGVPAQLPGDESDRT